MPRKRAVGTTATSRRRRGLPPPLVKPPVEAPAKGGSVAGEDFSYASPSKQQSDPGGVEVPRSATYPRHLHKWAGAGQINDILEVRTPDEHARGLAEGWCDDIQLEGPEPEAEPPKRKR